MGFTFIEAPDIFAPLEEPDYLVEGIIRRASLTECVAYGATGKSWIAAELAIAVVAGQAFLGRFETKIGTIGYLDYENGSYEMRRRLQAITRARGIPAPKSGLSVCCVPNVYMSDPGFGPQIEALALVERDFERHHSVAA